jgi:hypothetical protein
MKRVYLFTLILVVSAAGLFARPKLVVTTSANANYQLAINGLSVDNNYRTQNGFFVDDVLPQNYRVQLQKQKINLLGVVTYQIIFDGYIAFKNHTQTTLSIDIFNNATITEQQTASGGTWGNNNGRRTWGNGRNKKHKHNNCTQYQTMDNNAFNKVVQQLNCEYFDSNKIDYIKTITLNNAITAEQAKTLVQLLSFENNKLTLAKLLYNATTDKENFFIVQNAFTFSSTKQELNNYIQTHI